jgi:hypothetical protein
MQDPTIGQLDTVKQVFNSDDCRLADLNVSSGGRVGKALVVSNCQCRLCASLAVLSIAPPETEYGG